MRILVDGMPRTTGGIGSLVMSIADCASELDKTRNWKFDFIIQGRSGYLEEIKRKGYGFYIAPPIHDVFRYRKFVASVFEINEYDYLWFNNSSKVNLYLPDYAKKKGVSIIAHPHGVDIEEKGIKRYIFKVLNKANSHKMFSLIDIPFACSEEAADAYYKGSTELREKTVVLRNGIKVERYGFNSEKRNLLRKRLGLSDNDFLLGAVGRLTSVKNYTFLIDVMRLLEEKFKLIILGEGEDKQLLQDRILEQGLAKRISLLGKVDDVQDYLFAMDCFLMPSLHEGLPFSIIEAQCAGLPCIISDTLSREIQITDLVTFVELQKSKWKEKIENTERGNNRSSYQNIMLESPYNILNTLNCFYEVLTEHDTKCN